MSLMLVTCVMGTDIVKMDRMGAYIVFMCSKEGLMCWGAS